MDKWLWVRFEVRSYCPISNNDEMLPPTLPFNLYPLTFFR
jgi:hypothetical protein